VSEEGEKGGERSNDSGRIGLARFDNTNQASSRISAQVSKCRWICKAVGARPSRSACAVSLGCIHVTYCTDVLRL
ncbi:hypothetical protein PMAYCL1PPCAC_19523, partial [Pristionchus mayeri]